ncbi:MAG: hypothetical protein WCI56_08835 [Hyphomicrobiales bacterium]
MTGHFRLRRLFPALVLAGLLFMPGQSRAASWLEMNTWLTGPRYDGALPACDAALGWIASRFSAKESQYWNSSLQIVNFDRVRETAFRPWASGTIPRRFCSAKALVSDGRWRQVNFSIVEDGGDIGATWGVEFCVVGLDRNWAYNPGCRAARH